MSIHLTPKEKAEFLYYIRSFYAKGGIYEEFFAPNHLTNVEILKGITEYQKIVDKDTWGGGDSIDRENVKWILMSNRHDRIAKQIAKLQKQLDKYPHLDNKNLENFNKLSFGI